jgi:hypothetical protein
MGAGYPGEQTFATSAGYAAGYPAGYLIGAAAEAIASIWRFVRMF